MTSVASIIPPTSSAGTRDKAHKVRKPKKASWSGDKSTRRKKRLEGKGTAPVMDFCFDFDNLCDEFYTDIMATAALENEGPVAKARDTCFRTSAAPRPHVAITRYPSGYMDEVVLQTVLVAKEYDVLAGILVSEVLHRTLPTMPVDAGCGDLKNAIFVDSVGWDIERRVEAGACPPLRDIDTVVPIDPFVDAGGVQPADSEKHVHTFSLRNALYSEATNMMNVLLACLLTDAKGFGKRVRGKFMRDHCADSMQKARTWMILTFASTQRFYHFDIKDKTRGRVGTGLAGMYGYLRYMLGTTFTNAKLPPSKWGHRAATLAQTFQDALLGAFGCKRYSLLDCIIRHIAYTMANCLKMNGGTQDFGRSLIMLYRDLDSAVQKSLFSELFEW